MAFGLVGADFLGFGAAGAAGPFFAALGEGGDSQGLIDGEGFDRAFVADDREVVAVGAEEAEGVWTAVRPPG